MAVVGHVEWVTFLRVERLPRPGEIVDAGEAWEEPAGSGGVAAVRLQRMAGEATLYTALGDDEHGHRARRELERLGVRVETTFRPTVQRRAFAFVDAAGERTITVAGERLGPRGDDPLAWEELAEADAVYFTAGDEGALRAARAARVLVATSRVVAGLARARVPVDVLVGSARDPAEEYRPGDLEPPPRLVVMTEGTTGGRWWAADGRSGSWEPAPLPGPGVDAYGAGDSFAAGLTFALGAGEPVEEALAVAARWGAEALTRPGAHGRTGPPTDR